MTDTLPHHAESERTCLGPLLMHDDAMDTLAAMLKPSASTGEAHKILYSALPRQARARAEM